MARAAVGAAAALMAGAGAAAAEPKFELRLALPPGLFESGPSGALSAAIAAGADAGLIETLLAAGADPRRREIDGATPLHFAASRGDAVAAALLLGAGADPCATDVGGRPALSAEGLVRMRREGPAGAAAVATAAFLRCAGVPGY